MIPRRRSATGGRSRSSRRVRARPSCARTASRDCGRGHGRDDRGRGRSGRGGRRGRRRPRRAASRSSRRPTEGAARRRGPERRHRPRRRAAEHRSTDWDATFAVNLRAHFLIAREVLPKLGEGAALVFIGSVAGLQPGSRLPAYDASKAGLVGLCRHVALEGARQGVRANLRRARADRHAARPVGVTGSARRARRRRCRCGGRAPRGRSRPRPCSCCRTTRATSPARCCRSTAASTLI